MRRVHLPSSDIASCFSPPPEFGEFIQSAKAGVGA
jgi:hypothetical protein